MKTIHILMACALLWAAPMAHAEQQVEIVMEQTRYSYCEKLFYTIKVSEITGEFAIIHIRDSAGKSSSAVPMAIDDHENPVPSQIAFSKEIFPLGDYFVDVEYGGQKTTAGFTLFDSGKKCLPDLLKPIVANWIGGNLSDGLLVNSFERYADMEIIDVPFQVTEQNIDDVQIPPWVKNLAFWWIEGNISDYEFGGALEYLMEKRIIDVEHKNT